MSAALRLITIGFSHFCEKARWALDRTELAYREEDHVPLLHWPARLVAGGGRTVPALVTPAGVVRDSSDIVRYADEHLPAARRLIPEDAAQREEVLATMAELDRGLGPAVRRWLYFHVTQHDAALVRLLTCTGPRWERRVTRVVYPAIRAVIRRGLKIDAASAERSRQRMEASFAAVDERLADGRRFLVGDRFSAADLTFAALGGILVQPRGLPFAVPEPTGVAAIDAAVVATRARPSGRFIERLYAEERPAPRGLQRR